MATPIDDDTLQRFYDGDLSPREADELEARLAHDEAAQRRLAELGSLTRLFREAADELALSVDSSAMYAGIERELAANPQGARGLELQAGVVRALPRRALNTRRLWLGASGLAVAAAALLVVLRPAGDPLPTSPPTDSPSTAIAASERARVREVSGSRVENVDFGSSTGTVFELESEGTAVAVVWITDDEEGP